MILKPCRGSGLQWIIRLNEKFPYYLRQAGYYTSNNKKEDYNYLPSDKEGVWDESSGKASFRKRVEGQPFFHVQNFGRTHESQLFGELPKGKKYVVDPAPYLFAVLAECDDPIEVNLILNTAALLQDAAGVAFDMSKVEGAAWTKMEGLVPHRVNYLSGGRGEVPKKTIK